MKFLNINCSLPINDNFTKEAAEIDELIMKISKFAREPEAIIKSRAAKKALTSTSTLLDVLRSEYERHITTNAGEAATPCMHERARKMGWFTCPDCDPKYRRSPDQ